MVRPSATRATQFDRWLLSRPLPYQTLASIQAERRRTADGGVGARLRGPKCRPARLVADACYWAGFGAGALVPPFSGRALFLTARFC